MSGIFVLIAIAWVVYAAIAKKANAQQQAQRQRKLNENVAEAEARNIIAPCQNAGCGAESCAHRWRKPKRRMDVRLRIQEHCKQQILPPMRRGTRAERKHELCFERRQIDRRRGGLKRPPLARETMPKPSLNHVVKPMTESHHSHTEASISGREAKCEERYTEAEDAYSGAEQRAAYAVDMGDREKIIQGILYSEILSKPKALRK